MKKDDFDVPTYLIVCIVIIIFIMISAMILMSYAKANAIVVKVREEKVNNIVRLFVHNPGEYSVMIEDKGKLISHEFYGDGERYSLVDVVTDAPQNESMYATITYYEKRYPVIAYFEMQKELHHKDVVIHVHSPQDLEGAGWSRRIGKQTITGQTNVLE